LEIIGIKYTSDVIGRLGRAVGTSVLAVGMRLGLAITVGRSVLGFLLGMLGVPVDLAEGDDTVGLEEGGTVIKTGGEVGPAEGLKDIGNTVDLEVGTKIGRLVWLCVGALVDLVGAAVGGVIRRAVGPTEGTDVSLRRIG
jgi:hypothetical protein